MRAIIILAAVAFTHGAKLERTYLPPSNARTAGGSGNFLQTPVTGPSRNYQNNYSQSGNDYSGNSLSQSGNDYSQSGNGQPESEYNNVNYNYASEARPERPRAAFERNAAILRQDNSNDGETYSYAYETENGIIAEESGVATNGVEAQGGYSYTGDDGQVYSVRYTADQNGFVPQGDHLPTPPPVPEEILKALEQNARDEAAGIYDDGSYNEGKYAADDNGYNYQPNNAYNSNNDDSIVTNSASGRSGNAPSYNAPSNSVANTYGAPNAQNAQSFNSAQPIAPSYGAPTPSFTQATASNTFNGPNAGFSRTAAEKAYLPPFADQRGQARNAFGRRQQSFNARTGYNY